MGVIEELNEVLGEDVLTRAFAQALEAQGSSPRMGVDEIEQRLGLDEDVFVDADWYLMDQELIDSVPHMVTEAVETEALHKNLGKDVFSPAELAAHCVNHLIYDLEMAFWPVDFETLKDVTRTFAGHAKDAPKGREARLPSPHESQDIHRP